MSDSCVQALSFGRDNGIIYMFCSGSVEIWNTSEHFLRIWASPWCPKVFYTSKMLWLLKRDLSPLTRWVMALIHVWTQYYDPIRVATGNQRSGPVKSTDTRFHWPIALVSCSNWSDRRTESESGSRPLPQTQRLRSRLQGTSKFSSSKPEIARNRISKGHVKVYLCKTWSRSE